MEFFEHLSLLDQDDLTAGQKVQSIAKLVLKPKNVKLLRCIKQDGDSWEWREQDSAKIVIESVFGASESTAFTGTLILIVPECLVEDVRKNIGNPLYQCIGDGQQHILSSRQRRASKRNTSWEPDELTHSSRSTANLLVLAWRLAAASGRAIMCCSARSSGVTETTLPYYGQIERSGFIDEIDFDNPSQISSYFRTALSRIAYKVSPGLAETPKGDLLSNREPVSPDWAVYSMQPKQIEYEDLLRQELGSRELASAFIEICGHAFGFGSSSHPYTLLPAEIIVAIGALRISRRLANWTLEGDSFCCSIALFSDEEFPALGSGTSAFSPIIDIEKDIPFAFPFEEEIRKAAEAAQGEGLFLLVDATKGLLKSIGCHSRPYTPERHRRHAFLGSLVGRRGVVIHIRDQGFVEVYMSGNLCFWNDGFEWQYYPYQNLEATFEKHFSLPGARKSQDLREIRRRNSSSVLNAIRVTMLDTVRRLLDNKSSSIIVLLDDEDEATFEEVAHELLRRELIWARNVAKVYVDEIDAEALAGLLAVDGAHVIDKSGRLTSIARRLDAPPPRYSIKIRGQDGPDGLGSSENASRLRKCIDDDQRYDEFAVRQSENGDWMLNIYGIVDAKKWSSLSTLAWIKSDDVLKSDIEAEVYRSMQWCVCSSLPITRSVVDAVNSDVNYDEVVLSTSVPVAGARQFYVSLLFNNSQPLNASQKTSAANAIAQSVANHMNRRQVKLKKCFAVRVSEWDIVKADQETSEIVGVSTQPIRHNRSLWWISMDDSIRRAAKTREKGLPLGVKRRFRELLIRERSDLSAGLSHAGTGTRAASEVVNVLSRSTVIKVSASGGVKILYR
ncbi:hypothetical protein [Roseiconus lacunae]|uniref:hypothetical protein n=1 Tax=Roseiconus lacunae TaxID=2605694 RepID=UPI001E447142|nr:hypothetical protein [Roseiconus lacunae]